MILGIFIRLCKPEAVAGGLWPPEVLPGYPSFERYSHIGREYRDLKSTLLEVRPKNELSEIANGNTMNNELESNNSLLGLRIDPYRKTWKEDKFQCLQQVWLMVDILSKSQSWKDELSKSSKWLQPKHPSKATRRMKNNFKGNDKGFAGKFPPPYKHKAASIRISKMEGKSGHTC